MTINPKSTKAGRNFYGRIKGKGLKAVQEGYLKDLPDLALSQVTVDENPTRDKIQPETWFPRKQPLWLEVGFGAGEHLVHLAKSNPSVNLIGCEPYINGVATCLGKLRKEPQTNLRLHAGDARDLMDVLPDGSVDQFYLLYPDPWPKARHHRRRFVTPEHLGPLARVMRSGAKFHLATDIEDYVRQALQEVIGTGKFKWLAEGPEDWQNPWENWLSTRYEQKALRENRRPHYLIFERI